MQKLLNRAFRVHPGETGLILVLGFILLGNSIATQISGIAAVSGFLTQVGVEQILIVWLIDYTLIIITSGLQSLIVDRFGRVPLIRWTSFTFAMIFLALRIMFLLRISPWVNYSLLYVMSDQQWLFFPLIFWILAGDMFDVSQAKRLFPLIASIGLLGKILGILIAAFAPNILQNVGANAVDVINVNVFVYLLVYVVAMVGLDQNRIRTTARIKESLKDTLMEGWSFVKEIPAFRYLTIAVLTATVCDTIIEFRFLFISDKAFTDNYQQFYSLYRLGVTIAALGLQSAVTSRLMDRLTLRNSFLVYPVTLIGAFLWLMLFPGVESAVGAMVLMRLARDTINESARKSFQTLVPEERRGRVSSFMDNYLTAAGTILGSLLIGGILLAGESLNQGTGYFMAYLALGFGAASLSMWGIVRMRGVYDTSLFNWRLKRRQRTVSALDKLSF